MDQALLAKYVALESSLKKLEEEKESLRSQILLEMQNHSLEKMESEYFGTFSIAKRTTWKYSDKVNIMEEKLKIAKVKEQDREIATPIISESLRYTPVK